LVLDQPPSRPPASILVRRTAISWRFGEIASHGRDAREAVERRSALYRCGASQRYERLAACGKSAAALPWIESVFTTGYARNALVHQGRLDPGVELIVKPFTHSSLAAAAAVGVTSS